MCQRTDQKRSHGREGSAHGGARRRINVATEEVVHGDIPLARELEPVEAVPPVGVEAAVGEACDFTMADGVQDSLVRAIIAKNEIAFSSRQSFILSITRRNLAQ